jgi:hypothetical protein
MTKRGYLTTDPAGAAAVPPPAVAVPPPPPPAGGIPPVAAHPPDPDEQLSKYIRQAVERAADECDHTDPAGPIYPTTRACSTCTTTAVLNLFHTADALDAWRRRYVPPTVGKWEYPGPAFVS